MASNSVTKQLEGLPKIVKVLAFLFFGEPVSGVYRILRYLETKNTLTLVVGILCFFGLGLVMGIIDAITELTDNKVTVLAD